MQLAIVDLGPSILYYFLTSTTDYDTLKRTVIKYGRLFTTLLVHLTSTTERCDPVTHYDGDPTMSIGDTQAILQ